MGARNEKRECGVRERKWKQHESTIVALRRHCVARLQMNGRRFQIGGERGRKSWTTIDEKYEMVTAFFTILMTNIRNIGSPLEL